MAELSPLTLKRTKNTDDPLPCVADRNVDFPLYDRVVHEEEDNTLTVTLPRGETLLLDLSQMFGGKDDPAALWAIADWLKQRVNVDKCDALKSAINEGNHWAFIPVLKLEMIHATQRPVVQPAPDFDPAERTKGQVDASLKLDRPCHAENTANLVLDGRWISPTDAGPGTALPRPDWESNRAFRRVLELNHSPDETVELSGRHLFNDTRYRRVRYTLSGAGGGDAGNRHWRIRITEWERHDGDFRSGAPSKIIASTERLVFAETFRIV